MNHSNDKIERYHFDRFQKAYPLPDGCVAYGDKPDVILHGWRKIGIEMTNFFLQSGSLPSSEQRQKPLRSQIVVEAQKLYQAGNGRNIEVTITFDKGNPIDPARKRKLTKELATLVRSIDHRPSGEIEKYLFRDKMPGISYMYLNAREYPDAKWQLLGERHPRLMCKQDLEAIVRVKESKASEYQPCDAYWLLMVVDAMDVSQEQEISISAPHVSSDVFEKIIVFNTFGQIVEAK